MRLVPYKKNNWSDNPFQELEFLQREMNNLFNTSFSRNPWQDTTLLGSQWSPAIDVYDSKENILLKADLPGLTKDEIDISVQNNHLIIKGEKKKEKEVKEESFYKAERFYGSFYRSIQLPADVNADKVEAKYEGGVLTLTLPKKEESKPKQIAIDIK